MQGNLKNPRGGEKYDTPTPNDKLQCQMHTFVRGFRAVANHLPSDVKISGNQEILPYIWFFQSRKTEQMA